MWLVWVPLVVAWIALPWIALKRAEAPWAASAAARRPAYAALRWRGRARRDRVRSLLTRALLARMGKHWRMDVALDAKTELITDGPFRRIRHPIYAYQALLMRLLGGHPADAADARGRASIHVALVNVKARNEERHLLASPRRRLRALRRAHGALPPALRRADAAPC